MIINGKTRYVDVLDIPEGTSGDFIIKHNHRPEGTVLCTGNMRTMMYGQPREKILFDVPTRWHRLLEGGCVWMTDDPIEQRQHDEALKTARGRVLVGGLGLGYAVVALSKNRRVKEIVVVEKSQDVANLVWSATVKRAARKDLTITLIVEDLFVYLEHLKESFDWAFYDIWQSDGETTFHTVVVPLRRLSHKKIFDIVCWNEDVMRGQLCQGLHSRLMMLEPAAHDPLKNVFGLEHLNVDRFATYCDSIWIDWAVPFWVWYRDSKPSRDEASAMAQLYCQIYGQPDMADRWCSCI
jgi:hypothetical protein